MLRRSSLFLGVVLFALTSAASAINVSISPVTQDASVSDDVEVKIVVSGLGNGAAPSLGAYDLDLFFNPSLLDISSIFFGNQLDILGLGSFQLVTPGVGSVNLVEFSLDTPAELDTLQAGDFILAYVHFTALAPGTSLLSLSVNVFGDALGDPLAVEPISDAGVTITGQTTVPEPGTLALLGLASGLLALFGRTRRA